MSESTKTQAAGRYAPVNGLEMYYEVHGEGEPIVLIHGAFMTIEGWGETLTGLARRRRVIAVEFQGHGRTADIDRPLSLEQVADDVAALLDHLGLDRADIFGYSLGGGVALHLAIRHPERVTRLIAASVSFTAAGMHPGILEGISTITPEMFAGSPMEAAYLAVAPKPENWPALIEKVKGLDANLTDLTPASIEAIAVPALLIFGDADIVRLEHAVELFRLLGGGVAGDIAGLPKAQLAVLPGTTHIGVMMRAGWLVPMIEAFLAANSAENGSDRA